MLFRSKIENDCRLSRESLKFDFKVLAKVLTIGIPCALSSSLYSISNLQIQSAINSYGSSATAANSAAASVEGWAGSFTSAIGTTSLTFIGQNIGARNSDRIKKIFFMSLLIGLITGLVIGLGLFSVGAPLLRLYVGDDTLAVEYGLIRMQFILAFYFIAGMNAVLGTAIQAFGYSFLNMTNSIFSVLILRVFWMLIVYPKYETLTNLYFCYTVSWSLVFLINVIMDVAILPRKLKKMRCEINTLEGMRNEAS